MDRIAIIGAGPCGLGCARELDRLGSDRWSMFEREAYAGGLASSVLDPRASTWDLGGHVVFSHLGGSDALLDEIMGSTSASTSAPRTSDSTAVGFRIRSRTTCDTYRPTWWSSVSSA